MQKTINYLYSQPISAECFAVIDPETQTVLVSQNIDKQRPVASITKLLTAIIIVEHGDLDKPVTILPQDNESSDGRIELKAGNIYSRRDLLSCMLIGSANNAASALARDHSGEEKAFVEVMGAKARTLGMTSSFFRDSHGSKSEGQCSTVLDVARLATAADKNAVIRAIVSQKHFALVHNDGKKAIINSTNLLLKTLSICDGMKTGYTSAARRCLVASATLNGRRRIVITLNNTNRIFWQDAHHLLAWGLGQPIDENNQTTLNSYNANIVPKKADVPAPRPHGIELSFKLPHEAPPPSKNIEQQNNSAFEFFRMAFTNPCADWARKKLPVVSSRALFYPFGGPDIMFPLAMFPHIRDIILVGKESCATPMLSPNKFYLKNFLKKIKRRFLKMFPHAQSASIQYLAEKAHHLLHEPASATKQSLSGAKPTPIPLALALKAASSAGVSDALRHYLRTSFFITEDLGAKLNSYNLPGILPLLLAQLVQAGHPIHAVDSIEHGTALRILFGEQGAPRCLYYFRQDLADEFFTTQMPLYAYLENLGPFTAMLKSGSYLLHLPDFNRVSRFITDRAELIVQDPSGIPYADLCARNLHITVHGRFFGDIPYFKDLYDHTALYNAYRAKETDEPLPFGFGYLKNPSIASIIVAQPGQQHKCK